ncbi:hypothetical protein DJ019_09125 [Phenylobacterium kunshanense]|uniref:Uncharacterized protein n=1 Tax=Phenylobacterium kunshanense TaxID=1445034 RepID=A0A328BK72_9CAUL|nr:hypothetical protein DJ019_09125 [Phenylobacterium kunshanense]
MDAKSIQRVQTYARQLEAEEAITKPMGTKLAQVSVPGANSSARTSRKGTLNPPSKFSRVARVLLHIIDDHDGLNPERKLAEVGEGLRALIKDLEAKVGATPAPAKAPAKDPARAELEAFGALAIEKLTAELGAPAGDFSLVADRFLTEEDKAAGQAHFVCYRFHSRPGYVVKSFMAIMAPTPAFPGCSFFHAFVDLDEEGPRFTRGLVVPAGEWVYFLGAMKEYNALKLMMVKGRRFRRAKRFHGLALSMDSETPIAARFVMRRCEAKRHDQANIGVFELEDIREEIGDLLGSIRNRVDFEFDPHRPVTFDDRPISQKDMVHEVQDQFRRADGTPRFKIPDDDELVEFNPADDEFYTFNAALKIWSSEEAE